jgi:hypothetical protein
LPVPGAGAPAPDLIEVLGRGGGYVVGLAHAIQEDTPVADAVALFDAAVDQAKATVVLLAGEAEGGATCAGPCPGAAEDVVVDGAADAVVGVGQGTSAAGPSRSHPYASS